MIRTCTSYDYAITIKEVTDDLKLKELLYLVLSCGSLSAKYTSFECKIGYFGHLIGEGLLICSEIKRKRNTELLLTKRINLKTEAPIVVRASFMRWFLSPLHTYTSTHKGKTASITIL